MNNRLSILGIAVLLICVGLSGCQDIGKNVVSIEELLLHLDRYQDKTVTVKGFVYIFTSESGVTDKGYTILLEIPESIDTNELFSTVEYYVTGILRRGVYEGVGMKVSYIEVTNIESA